MRIGIDGLPFQGNPAGVGNYFLSVIEELYRTSPEFEMIVFTNNSISYLTHLEQIKIIEDKRIFRKLKRSLWLKLFAWRLINKNNIDFYFSSDGFLPFFLSSKIKKIAIIHDLNYKIVPDTLSPFHSIVYRLFFKRDVKKLDYIITNTQATQKKIKRFLQKDINLVLTPKIDCIYGKIKEMDVKNKLIEIGINYPYFLSVATQEPRKNIDKTIQAFIAVKEEGFLPNHKLLLVGGKGWKNRKINQLLNDNKYDIKQLGYVSKEFLPYLYNGAEAFLFPSKYEGFGIPVREAIESGCKVIASDIEELREVGNDNVVYINPDDEVEYKEALKNIIHRKSEVFVDSFKSQSCIMPLFNFIINK
jgi:glycosyltransferase involved in cell wall biosynthesis